MFYGLCPPAPIFAVWKYLIILFSIYYWGLLYWKEEEPNCQTLRPERPAELRHAGSGVRAGEAAGRAGQADVEHGVGGGAGEEGVGVGHLHQTPVEMVESRGRVESLFTLAGVAAPHPAVARLEGALQIRKKK